MILSKLIRKAILACFCSSIMLYTHPATAQRQAAELEAISRKMFRERNDRFILAEALKDGFIQDGKSYSISFTSKAISINGKPLPEPFQTHYLRLMKKYHALDSVGKGDYRRMNGSMSGGGFTIKDVLNPESTFRKPDYLRGSPVLTEEMMQILTRELVADGILAPGEELKLSESLGHMWIKGHGLSGAMNTKYLLRIIELQNNRPGMK